LFVTLKHILTKAANTLHKDNMKGWLGNNTVTFTRQALLTRDTYRFTDVRWLKSYKEVPSLLSVECRKPFEMQLLYSPNSSSRIKALSDRDTGRGGRKKVPPGTLLWREVFSGVSSDLAALS